MTTKRARNNPFPLLLAALLAFLAPSGAAPAVAAELRIIYANDMLGELEPRG
jgi:hypothetical protein